MKILIAPDKFKGSLSAIAVCEAIAAGLKQKNPALDITYHPMADGGDGSLEILAQHLALKEQKVNTQDPLGRAIEAAYFIADDAAFIELASASGLVLLKEEERDPLQTSSLGTGILIAHALSQGFQNIYLFLGGSATNDAGMGIAHALGFQFLDAANNVLAPIGQNLSKVANIHDQHLYDFRQIRMALFYDVLNPLFGKQGAAYIYAPQKGARPDQVQFLDDGLRHFSACLQQQREMNVSNIPGIGAAGGIGAGLVALCGAQMRKGFSVISELTGLEHKIKMADQVISGEGRLDEQSLQGKVIDGIAQLCIKHQKPLHLIVGKNELSKEALLEMHVDQVYSIMDIAQNGEDAMRKGEKYLKILASDLF